MRQRGKSIARIIRPGGVPFQNFDGNMLALKILKRRGRREKLNRKVRKGYAKSAQRTVLADRAETLHRDDSRIAWLRGCQVDVAQDE